ncbi:GGDEF domain-containing protein [Marinibactrum halimedae]|nr:GGDEF domain-containing protein [Marinibactrum halimedae]MCD9459895.1 GGDEF domain-containing protein [Marinibactrum halimedae]
MKLSIREGVSIDAINTSKSFFAMRAVLVSLLLFLPVNAVICLTQFERKTSISTLDLWIESCIILQVSAILAMVQRLQYNARAYFQLSLAFSLLLISMLTDLMDELTELNDLYALFAENITFISALVLLLTGFYTWQTHYDLLVKTLEEESTIDPLTKTFNRRYMDSLIESYLTHPPRGTCDMSLMVIDLDNFKRVNDTYGHHIGDIVLQVTAEVINEQTGENDKLARMGGEEFEVVMFNTDEENAVALAESIGKRLSETTIPPVGKVTASIGIATYRNDETLVELRQRADSAMYRAKALGKNRVEIADDRPNFNEPITPFDPNKDDFS